MTATYRIGECQFLDLSGLRGVLPFPFIFTRSFTLWIRLRMRRGITQGLTLLIRFFIKLGIRPEIRQKVRQGIKLFLNFRIRLGFGPWIRVPLTLNVKSKIPPPISLPSFY